MRGIPDYDILVTNPPYSGDHKQKLLTYLLSSTARKTANRSILLFVPLCCSYCRRSHHDMSEDTSRLCH